MKLLYFATVREHIGLAEEELSLPPDVATVAGLVGWLRTRGPEYAEALAAGAAVRVALDQIHAGPESSIRGVREAALFRP